MFRILCVVGLLSSTAMAQPSQEFIRQQMARAGFIDWRADVKLHEDRKEVRSSDGDRTTNEEWSADATLVVVVPGPAPASFHLEVGQNESLYTTREASGDYRGKSSTRSRDFTDDRTMSGKALPRLTSVTLEFDPSSKKWQVAARTAFDMSGEYTQTCDDKLCSHKTHSDVGQHIGFTADQNKPNGTFERKGDTFIFDGKIVEDVDEMRGGTHVTIKQNITAHIVFTPERTVAYEAVLMPKKPAAYHAWIPKGPTLPAPSPQSDRVGAAWIEATLELRDVKTHQPALAVPYTPEYSLETSHAPGYCMNFPAPDTANASPDLFFEKDRNLLHDATAETHLVGHKIAGRDTVVVSSRDFGAFGQLQATVRLPDGSTIVARAEVDGTSYKDGLAIPEDTNRNQIADQWEKDEGIFGNSYPPSWDEEEDPPNMATKGDGIALYDEYRGFYVSDRAKTLALQNEAASAPPARAAKFQVPASTFQRLSPKQRDLLIAVETNPTAQGMLFAGALRFAAITGITVRFVGDRHLLAPLAGDEAGYPRWANFNSPEASPFGPKAAAVWAIAADRLPPPDKSSTSGTTKPGDVGSPPGQTVPVDAGPPIHTVYSHVYTDGVTKVFDDETYDALNPLERSAYVIGEGWQRVLMPEFVAQHPGSFNLAGVAAYAAAHRADLIAEAIEFVIIHELGHAVGGMHHHAVGHDKESPTKRDGGGEETCPMRYWHVNDAEAVLSWLSGKWNPALTAPHGNWKFCTTDDHDWDAHMRLRN